MKKNLIFTLFLVVGLTLSAQPQHDVQARRSQNVVEGCSDTLTLGFSARLGMVSFVSDQEWTVKGNGITQVWSDAVHATGCQDSLRKFRGDSARVVFLADCRYNPDERGIFFSWCAVAMYGSTLCPSPWRVPTREDFCNLDKILNDSKTCHRYTKTLEQITETYINTWGGIFSGATSGSGSFHFIDVKAYYWSQTEFDEGYAYYLTFDIHGNVVPQNIESVKSLGFLLRCVR
jgi:uncharacterized protein (TIGR02145 family)